MSKDSFFRTKDKDEQLHPKQIRGVEKNNQTRNH